MTLIAALLGIAVDRLLTHLHEIRRYDWFLDYFDWMRNRFSGGLWDQIVGVITVLAPLWLAVALLQSWSQDWLFGLAGLLFYIATFVYCVGPRDLSVDVDTWCEVSESTDAGLRQRAARRLLDEQPSDDPQLCARQLTDAVLLQANERIFSVLFWFVLLGPLGAAVYRSVSLLGDRRSEPGALGDSICWLQAVLVWLPARFVALGYALSGHFESALEGWREAHREHHPGVNGSELVLVRTGAGALDLDENKDLVGDLQAPVRAAMRLVWRNLILWAVVLSVMTLAGWAS